jgi:hypothetical protein
VRERHPHDTTGDKAVAVAVPGGKVPSARARTPSSATQSLKERGPERPDSRVAISARPPSAMFVTTPRPPARDVDDSRAQVDALDAFEQWAVQAGASRRGVRPGSVMERMLASRPAGWIPAAADQDCDHRGESDGESDRSSSEFSSAASVESRGESVDVDAGAYDASLERSVGERSARTRVRAR